MAGLASNPSQDPHSGRMKGRDRRMVFAEPGVRTEVKPGEKQSARETHSKAPIKARIGEDAMCKRC
eukprot:7757337-Heterocapsa_arctica.AAC.2